MKLILILFIVFLGTNIAFADKYIPWSENRKLIWDDFQGDVGRYPEDYKIPDKLDLAFTWGEPKLLNYNFTKVDSMICQIQITDINAIGMFDTESSWVNNTQKNNLKLLDHEQGHFDIIEVFARKIKTDMLYQIIECPHGFYDESQIHNQIRLLASEIGNMQQKMHDNYDMEVKNDASTQNTWDKNIEKLLMEGESIPIFHKEMPPLVQIKNGIKQKDVTCTQGWILTKNHSDKPVCVTPAVSNILEKRGWKIGN